MARGPLVILLAFIASSVVWWGEGTARAATDCSGVQIREGDDISLVADAHGARTTFCINDGEYPVVRSVKVQSGDRFRGVYGDGTRPIVRGAGATTIFDTFGSDSAAIIGLRVQGAIGSEACSPNCGRGIGGGGTNLYVSDAHLMHNANQGIGGVGPGLLVVNSVFDDNGYDSTFTGETAGPVSAAGIKSVNSMIIRNSVVKDNRWAGLWCDIDCTRFEVHDSTVVRNGKVGVHDEISSGAAIVEGSTIRYNGGLAAAGSRRADLIALNSKNLNVFGNTFGGKNGAALIVAFDEARFRAEPRGDGGFALRNIDFHHNRLNGDALSGCGLPDWRVHCYKNGR
ncbi:hypothetical protein GBA63_18245 [Rubrobacter tropicus]|uniref:Right handed beta helix domain-containing protein n=1 Tax=Rubrobacter tropicus TaxID=2653851 RepID=A0A6G8QCX5_9ACTN|nr:right-handed parallel beta-helix repeat-containing protein [Rubrobacter tropicus]QIN84364.1 hypothetical protein GBA63_18245 [Rubrobacter tropicus]